MLQTFNKFRKVTTLTLQHEQQERQRASCYDWMSINFLLIDISFELLLTQGLSIFILPKFQLIWNVCKTVTRKLGGRSKNNYSGEQRKQEENKQAEQKSNEATSHDLLMGSGQWERSQTDSGQTSKQPISTKQFVALSVHTNQQDSTRIFKKTMQNHIEMRRCKFHVISPRRTCL